jgi:hypothetical protein
MTHKERAVIVGRVHDRYEYLGALLVGDSQSLCRLLATLEIDDEDHNQSCDAFRPPATAMSALCRQGADISRGSGARERAEESLLRDVTPRCAEEEAGGEGQN